MTDDGEATIVNHGDASDGLITDLHSHLLPGVDDGARTVDDTLDGVGRMVERGVRRIVTTPHLNASTTLDESRLAAALQPMDAAFEVASAAVGEAYPEVEFLRAHEVMLDVPDPDLSDPRLWLGASQVILMEWPGLQFPPGTPRVVDDMVGAGVRPLIAHPERYRTHNSRLTTPGDWKEAGAWLQVNHGSLVGRYGPHSKAHAFTLLERGWADCLASDFHGRAHLRPYIRETGDLFRRLGADHVWSLLTEINPARIQRGEAPKRVPPVIFPRGMMERIRSLLGGVR